MLLNSIKVKNFRQFKGEQEVTFSTDEQKNLTVILGDNTAGKTTLIQAFKWGLYGNTNFKTGEKLLNSDVELSMRKDDIEEVIVNISLVHEGLEYHIERSQRFRSYESGSARADSLPKFTIHCFENCQYRRIKDEYGNMVEKILPQNLSDYFFFDGEKISSISEKKNLKEAVTNLMGLTPVMNMINHLNPKERGTAYTELSMRLVQTGDSELDVLKRQVDRIKKDIEADTATQSRKEMERVAFDDAYDRALKALENHKAAVKKTKRRSELLIKLRSYNSKFDTHILDIKNDFDNLGFRIFINPLMLKAAKIIKSADMDDKGIPDMNSRSIDYIIERGFCICGTDLKKEPVAMKEIMKQKEFLPPQSIGTSIHDFVQQIESNDEKFRHNYDVVKRSYKSIIDTKEIISEIKDEITEIGDFLKKQPDVSKLEEDYQTAKANRKQVYEYLSTLKTRIDDNEQELKSVEGKIKKIVENDGVNDATLRQMQYAKILYDRMVNVYDNKSRRILEEMNSTIKDVFSKMYHGVRDIHIDEEYRVHIAVERSGNLEASSGLDVVKNFAFIAGLLKIAKESIKEDDIQTEPYPLVMDAPFSKADAVHISNISKLLPDVAEQIVMMIMDKDWSHVEPVVANRIGHIYRLDKKTETYTIIKAE